MSFAMIFPGQGSQSVGMLDKHAASSKHIKATMDEASKVLDYDTWGLAQQGPESKLNKTEYTQPLLLAASVAMWRAFCDSTEARPTIMAGHSLGEYTALVCAGVLDFHDALRLVRTRGKLMQTAVASGKGAMAAIIGLTDQVVAEVCKTAAEGEVVEAVNFNAPGQVVIAGNVTAVDRAMKAAEGQGARMVTKLAVSAPSHCSLMKNAAKRLSHELEGVPLRDHEIPILHNIDARDRHGIDDMRRALVSQLHSPVRWVDVMTGIADSGATLAIECGPGRVLTGLVKRNDKRVKGLAMDVDNGIRAAAAAAEENE